MIEAAGGVRMSAKLVVSDTQLIVYIIDPMNDLGRHFSGELARYVAHTCLRMAPITR